MFLRTPRLPKNVALLGPAFVAAVAYVDPGNVATNVTAGATFGYTLVWVVVLANAMAVVVQYLSAKLGLVTGRSLATHMGETLPRPARIAYWLQAEAVAIATDVAEVVGGALALYLLFDLPLVSGALVTVAVSMVVLRVGDRFGQSALERVVMAFLLLIAVGFTAGLVVAPPEPAAVAEGLVPTFAGTESVLLASAIIGATVMPHVIYLHSGLTAGRLGRRGERRTVSELLAVTRIDVVVALVIAGSLNLALLLMAASSLSGLEGTDTLEGVHALMTSELGSGVALLFAVALLGSGLASTSVGCAAGAEVMHGLLRIRVPVVARRIVTVIPALVILVLGVEPSWALVGSQVVLSMGIPFALVPLLWLTARPAVMGEAVNRRITTALAALVATLVIVLNVALLVLTFA
ncbi:Nramp family divalent metal transporter [Mumia sp. zg.B17]|uniref:Nramp family divalent metal transporter n=1 Tax=unclassified Mumia TaxID=2621872 RepID=UPI001C6E7952|nr:MULTISPECIES: Nramp family divalent metal transporter [unclassified Mumia]MBW9207314.1 Nramp family divalent metal transporter [Mumia sp. zg.B17]MBW9210338.1 Nramp family divalent metal transporter [Mumia sp. zg.B21]